MASDSALIERLGEFDIAARIYEWDHPAVTIGRFQSPITTLGPDCRDWSMRPTGGLAVLHGHDVTFSVAARLGAIPGGGTRELKRIYAALAGILQIALSGIRPVGFTAAGSRCRPQGDISDCFALATGSDLIDASNGAKVCGCALVTSRTSALLQASIPIRTPNVDAGRWIRGGQAREVLETNALEVRKRLKETLQALSDVGF